MSGSAPFRRAFYDTYARRLAQSGYVVLLPDKRGAGESGGTFVSDNNGSRENLTLLAQDVVRSVEFLTNHPAVNADRIGLLGVSQAGWVAPLAASMTTHLKFMVLVTAPAVSVGEESEWSALRGDDETDSLVSIVEADKIIAKTPASGYDPRKGLAELALPTLWLFGDLDNSIPTRKSIAVLRSVAGENNEHILYSVKMLRSAIAH